MASLSAFVDAPSVSFLDDCKKAQLVDIAEHYKIAVVGSKRKDEIKAVIVSSLFEQGVLQKSEFGVAGVVPVVVQTASLTFEQQKELLAMQFEQEKLRLEEDRLQLELRGQQQEEEKRLEVEKVLEVEKIKCERSVQGVIGDVEKMVAIPAVVQSFHQAPPIDLQVRGDPRAPEWANVIIAEERVIGRIRSGMVPDKKPVCADPDVGSGFEPFITEAVVSVVETETGDFVLSGMEMGLIPVTRHTIVLDCELVRRVVYRPVKCLLTRLFRSVAMVNMWSHCLISLRL
ncbi:hypothetical protein NQZ68_008982 [Dissostichus eleginoides]|nr:hypothetical protein NQZ68_008982 [Dissostichus eleginoides]